MTTTTECRWIQPDSWLPPEGLPVLICCRKDSERIVQMAARTHETWWTHSGIVNEVECWALAPEPPYDEEAENESFRVLI